MEHYMYCRETRRLTVLAEKGTGHENRWQTRACVVSFVLWNIYIQLILSCTRFGRVFIAVKFIYEFWNLLLSDIYI